MDGIRSDCCFDGACLGRRNEMDRGGDLLDHPVMKEGRLERHIARRWVGQIGMQRPRICLAVEEP